MDKNTVTLALLDLVKHIDKAQLPIDYQAEPGTSNEVASAQYDMTRAMGAFIVASTLNAHCKKKYDKAKEQLDFCAASLGKDIEVDDGSTSSIYRDNNFSFQKRRNTTTSSINTKKLLIELNKLGVDPSLLKKAVDNASETKRGSVYYEVDVVE